MTHLCTDYLPDMQAQGDCINCGHAWEIHQCPRTAAKIKSAQQEERNQMKQFTALAVQMAVKVSAIQMPDHGEEPGEELLAMIAKHGWYRAGEDIIIPAPEGDRIATPLQALHFRSRIRGMRALRR